jgi:hypothetical protein
MKLVLTLVPREVPLLQLGLLKLEVFSSRLCGSALLRNSERETLIQRQSNELGTVPWLMDLETDVEVLSSQKVGPGDMVSFVFQAQSSKSFLKAMEKLL